MVRALALDEGGEGLDPGAGSARVTLRIRSSLGPRPASQPWWTAGVALIRWRVPEGPDSAHVMSPPSRPTAWQTRRTRAVVRWYLARYYGTPWDTGTARMFMAPNLVGHFAITEGAYTRCDPDALFKLLVATAMFQKRSDQQSGPNLALMARCPPSLKDRNQTNCSEQPE